MSGLDVPYLAHAETTSAAQKRHPPHYDANSEHVHNHFYQLQPDEPSRVPWYRQKKCFYISITVAVSIIAISIAVSIAVTMGSKARNNNTTQSIVSIADTAVPSIRESSTAETSTPPPSVVVVVMTATQDLETETTTLTLGPTQQSSTSNSEAPVTFTKFITLTEQNEPLPGSSSKVLTTQTSLSPSSLSAHPTGRPMSSPALSNSMSPNLASNSNIAAVEVKSGSDSRRRRLLLWQDGERSLIARDTWGDSVQVYRISDSLNGRAIKAKHGTALAATSDVDGSIHVFYVSDENNSIVHLVQHDTGTWVMRGQGDRIATNSTLSVTWHKDASGMSRPVLAYQSPDDDICLYVAEAGSTYNLNLSSILHLKAGSWGGVGFAIASGRKYQADLGDATDEYVALYLIFEGAENVIVAECLLLVESDDEPGADCYWLSTGFSDKGGEPIKIRSHPTKLAWSYIRLENNKVPTINGFLMLDGQGSSLTEHRLVSVSNPSLLGSSVNGTQYQTDMETYEINGGDIQAMAMSDENTLFVRSNTRLFEFWLEGGKWENRQEIRTEFTKEERRSYRNQ